MANIEDSPNEVHSAVLDRMIAVLNDLLDKYDMAVGLLVDRYEKSDYLNTPAGKIALAESYEETQALCFGIEQEILDAILDSNNLHGAIASLPIYDRLFYGTVMTDSKFIDKLDEFKSMVDDFAVTFAEHKSKLDQIFAFIPEFVKGAEAPTTLKTPEFPGRY